VSSSPARILLADDHPVVRHGLRQMLDREPDLRVVAEAADGAEAVEQAVLHEPELAIVDIAMPRLTGLQAARQILARSPDTRVLVLSMHSSEQYCVEALRAGAAGYVELVAACRAALRGEPFTCPLEARAAVDRARAGAPEDPLTAREGEVVKLVAEGHTTREIARALVISEKTVDRHKGNVLEKLGLRDRVDLTRYAIRRGLVEP
jgi:DNA-binding NarL/FixJ family response regulator